MKSNYIISLMVAISVLSCSNSNPNNLLPFELTVTYKMLELDAKLFGENSNEVELCKKLMENACLRITKQYSNDEISYARIEEVGRILASIDSTFTEFNFLFYTNPKDKHYNILSLALKEDFNQEAGIISTNYQKHYWNHQTANRCKLIDCDQYSRIYIGIAQMINLPLKVIYIPDHYYLRWYFKDGTYVSWDANDATLHPIESTINGYYKVAKSNKSYLTNYFPKEHTANEVYTNYKLLCADNIWDENPVINIYQARENYLEVIKENYISTSPYNNLTWLHIMNPQLDSLITNAELHKYIDKSISLERDVNYYDAKACLFAMENKFDTAIRTENEGLMLEFDKNNKLQKAKAHLQCFLKNEVCRTIK